MYVLVITYACVDQFSNILIQVLPITQLCFWDLHQYLFESVRNGHREPCLVLNAGKRREQFCSDFICTIVLYLWLTKASSQRSFHLENGSQLVVENYQACLFQMVWMPLFSLQNTLIDTGAVFPWSRSHDLRMTEPVVFKLNMHISVLHALRILS